MTTDELVSKLQDLAEGHKRKAQEMRDEGSAYYSEIQDLEEDGRFLAGLSRAIERMSEGGTPVDPYGPPIMRELAANIYEVW